ncbi:MAG: hypothetical protein ACI8T6_000261 [Candidatus Poseidoniaceae archaeon]|jgi:hypothetical protein
MVLGHEANRVSNSTPLMDSDDLKQTLWLLPIVACWQGHNLLSLFTSEIVYPLKNLSLLISPFLN